MYRYRIDLAYKGTNFHGWQIQENARSVQGDLNKALSLLLSEKIQTLGCGRTDTGVHAHKYVAHFDVVDELNIGHLIYKLNSILGPDIALHNIIAVSADFHARFGAISRTYKYFVHTQKDPFSDEYSHFCPYLLDYQKMNCAAQYLLGCGDFGSFAKTNTDVKTNICTVTTAKWEKVDEHKLEFTIVADRFLRNMVRAITGTLIDIGRGKLAVEDMPEIINAENRSKAGPSVPAKGLFLWEVLY